MFHQQVGASDLAFKVLLRCGIRAEVNCVILSHVVLQRLTVGA